MYVSAMLVRLLRGRSTPAMRAIELLESLTLTLLVFGDYADHPHHTLAVDDLALVTNLLYRCSYFHNPAFSRLLSAFSKTLKAKRRRSFIAIHDASAVQVVGRKLHGHFIARQNADEVLAHFSRD